MRLPYVITCCKPDTWQLVNVVAQRFHIKNWNTKSGENVSGRHNVDIPSNAAAFWSYA